MTNIQKKIIGFSSLIMAIILSRFAYSKLAGMEVSVNQFIQMSKPLGINPTFFRLFSGVLILIATICYFTNVYYSLFKKDEKQILPNTKKNYFNLNLLANGLGVMIMLGALLSEFFLRNEPKWVLVYLASGIIIFSINNLRIIFKERQKLN